MRSKAIHAFSNPVRLKLLCCLDKKTSNVNELINSCGIAQSAVSQHLAKLKRAGLVTSRRRGKFIYYSLVDEKTGKIATEFNDYLKEVN